MYGVRKTESTESRIQKGGTSLQGRGATYRGTRSRKFLGVFTVEKLLREDLRGVSISVLEEEG